MVATKLQGRNAGSHKYDLITAMGTMALASPPGQERLIFRLITLITARYNWAKDDLSVGQREIARLWSVTERTVKREMAKLRALGWLEVRRQGARGRVTSYRLRSETILRSSAPNWEAIGPDFVARMAPPCSATPTSVVTVDFKATSRLPEEGAWRDVCLTLQRDAPDHYASWYQRLSFEACENGQLHLNAPNRFIANYVEAHLMAPLLRSASERLGPLREVILSVV